MSLSVLLDYRIDDNKEGTFEVSLFAELFNEMLMRDCGFKLYKAILAAPEKPSKEELRKEKERKAIEELKREEGDNTTDAKGDDSKANSSPSVVVLDEDSSSSSASKKQEKKKLVTTDKELLLACTYFDLGHCGYFESKDLEDILLTMNLSLSRAQIRKLVAKVVTGKDQVKSGAIFIAEILWPDGFFDNSRFFHTFSRLKI